VGEEAAGIGVPFVTAMEGFRRAGMPNKTNRAGDGRQRQGSVRPRLNRELAWAPRVIGVVRKNEPYGGHAIPGST